MIKRPLYEQASRRLSMMPLALDFELTVKAMALLLPDRMSRAREVDARFSIESTESTRNTSTESLISGISLLQSAPNIPMRYWISSTGRAREWGDKIGSQVKKRVVPEAKHRATTAFSQLKSRFLKRF